MTTTITTGQHVHVRRSGVTGTVTDPVRINSYGQQIVDVTDDASGTVHPVRVTSLTPASIVG